MKNFPEVINKNGKNAVNARELWIYMDVKTRFNDWIAGRIKKYDFTEGIDFILLTEKIVSGNNARSNEYYISIDMAKELSMIENNKWGKKARKHFIEREKEARDLSAQLPNLPRSFPEALRALADKEEEAQQLLIERQKNKPKVDFYEQVTSSEGFMDMKKAAKALKLPLTGRNNLLLKLREWKLLMPNNEPYQQFINQGYFSYQPVPFEKKNGEKCTGFKPMVSGKGLQFILSNYNLEKGLNEK